MSTKQKQRRNRQPDRRRKERRFQRDMSTQRQDFRFEVGRPDEGMRLDSFLDSRISWRSRAEIQELIRRDRIQIEGEHHREARHPRPATRLRSGDEIVVWVNGPGGDAGQSTSDLEIPIVFEDEQLLAVSKPPGVSLYPTRRHRSGSLIERVHRLMNDRGLETPPSPPSPCHRLDRETSGLLLFAKDLATRAHLGRQFEERTLHKCYLAWVSGKVTEDHGETDLPLGADPASQVEIKRTTRQDGQPALTRWRVRSHSGRGTLLELRPVTGRQHQLRVHLAAIGHPILGDKLYLGGDSLFLRSLDEGLSGPDYTILGHTRLALHALRLDLEHPATGEPLRIEASIWPDLAQLADPQ